MTQNTVLIPSTSSLILVLTPLLLSFLPIYYPGKQSTCGYAILLVAIYWVTNAMPMAVTGIIPAVFFGVTGILDINQITQGFFFSGLWLIIGSLMLALAVQSTKLHARIALKILLTIGTEPKRLVIGFMLTAHLLSMFIANLAVLAMLLPIAKSVLEQVREQIAAANSGRSQAKESNEVQDLNQKGSIDLDGHRFQSFEEKIEFSGSEESLPAVGSDNNDYLSDIKRLQAAVTLCIPYACSIGGVSTLSGSAPNIVANDLIQSLFPATDKIPFGTWFFYCAPGSFLITALSCAWIIWLHFGFRNKNKDSIDEDLVRKLLQNEYDKLGAMDWGQRWVLALFLSTTFLWFTRSPGFMPGWGQLFPKGYLTDGTVALVTGLLVFVIPKNKPVIFGYANGNRVCQPKLLTYKEFQDGFPWDVIFIAGGGLTLAVAATESGLSSSMAAKVLFLANWPPWVVCLMICSLSSLLTETTTGMAITTFLIPVVAKLSVTMRVHPYYFCLPLFLSTTQSFMLPVASPINVIAYTLKFFTIKDMVKTGWMMNLIGLFVINLSINTYGRAIFGVHQFPQWAEPNNGTY